MDCYCIGFVSKFVHKGMSLIQKTIHICTRTCALVYTCTQHRLPTELSPANHPSDTMVVFVLCSLTPGHRGALSTTVVYVHCLACGDLSVWDSTILSRQGETICFGFNSQRQKHALIALL